MVLFSGLFFILLPESSIAQPIDRQMVWIPHAFQEGTSSGKMRRGVNRSLPPSRLLTDTLFCCALNASKGLIGGSSAAVSFDLPATRLVSTSLPGSGSLFAKDKAAIFTAPSQLTPWSRNSNTGSIFRITNRNAARTHI